MGVTRRSGLSVEVKSKLTSFQTSSALRRGEHQRAARFSPALAKALEVWKDVSFTFESTDVPDAVATVTV